MKLKQSYLLLLLLLLILPSSAYGYYQTVNLESVSACNFYFGIIGLSITLVAVGYMVSLVSKLSGLLKRAWLLLLSAGSIVAILQSWAIISAFFDIEINFIFCLLEFAIPVLILLAVLTFKKFIMGIIEKKSFSQKNNKE